MAPYQAPCPYCDGANVLRAGAERLERRAMGRRRDALEAGLQADRILNGSVKRPGRPQLLAAEEYRGEAETLNLLADRDDAEAQELADRAKSYRPPADCWLCVNGKVKGNGTASTGRGIKRVLVPVPGKKLA